MPALEETAAIPWQGKDAPLENKIAPTIARSMEPAPFGYKEKKSVHFAPKLLIRGVLCRHDFTAEEARTLWMDHFDQCNNKQDIYNTVYLMRSGLGSKLNEDDHFCARGLEKFVSPKHEQDGTRKRSIGIALAMQRVLRRSGTSDPEMIARAYHKYTLKSQYIAQRKGIRDQEEVKGDVQAWKASH